MQTVSLTYKCVALAIMLAEANFSAEQLQLPIKRLITKSDLKRTLVIDPQKMPFSGQLDTQEYSFSIGEGYLRFITNLKENRDELSVREFNERLSKTNALIDADQAYHIAKGWLKATEVDIDALERQHPPRSEPRFFYSNGTARTYLPVFDVEWGEPARPVIRVSLNGATTNL